MQPHRHNLGLDLVRSAAILLVLYSHTADWWMAPGPDATVNAAYVGRIGVEMFFSLSGFLIGGILLRQIEDGFDPAALGRFWCRRWMRTLPAYWTVMGLVGWHFGVFDWRGLLFLQSWMPRATWTPLMPHTWSLVLEEWFYLFVPALLLAAVLALGRARRRWAVPLVCLALVVACTMGRDSAGLSPHPFWGPEPSTNPVLRLDCAVCGLLAAWLVQRRPIPAAAAWVLLVVGSAVLLVMGWVWAGIFAPERLVAWGMRVWIFAWAPLHSVLEEFGAACFVLALHRLLPSGRGPLAWAAQGLAALSYAVYLVHVPVLGQLRQAGLDDASGWLARAGMMGGILVAAAALRYGVERPVLALRDRLAPDRRPRAVSVASA